MPNVLITPSILAGVEAPHLDILRENQFAFTYPARPVQLTEEDLLRDLKGIDAVIAGSEPYTRRVLDAYPTLRVIARAGVGFDSVDLDAATKHGTAVTITPGTNQEAVAEHTFALILTLAKNVIPQHNALRAGQWSRQANLPLRGRTLGIAGLGRIGKAVAVRGAGFGMRLLAYEPAPDMAFVHAHHVTLVPFDRLAAEADFLTVHVPLASESKYLVNRQTLALMKPTAFLINTSRGGLVCEADLLEALRARRIAGAGLDVFEQEPAVKNALFQLDNVVVTPHTAGVDLQSRDDMAAHAARAIVALRKGEWPAHQVVNPEVQAKFRW
jgi:phosphoglycerate dehydrogenase-like enzyme